VNYNTPPVPVTAQAAAFQKTMEQVKKGIKQDEGRDAF
jgi:hypothetical protein